jgi:hypothetical protein
MDKFVQIEACGVSGEPIRAHQGIAFRSNTSSARNAPQSAIRLGRDFGLAGYTDIDGRYVRVSAKGERMPQDWGWL